MKGYVSGLSLRFVDIKLYLRVCDLQMGGLRKQVELFKGPRAKYIADGSHSNPCP